MLSAFLWIPVYGQYNTYDTAAPPPYSVAFVYANSGVGIPMGMYVTSGYAKPGLNFSIEGTSTIDDTVLGWTVKVDYAKNPVSGIGLANSLAADNPGFTFIPVQNGYYSYVNVFTGPTFVCRSIHRFGFSIKAMAGIIYASSPVSTLHAYDRQGNEYLLWTVKQNANAFCFEGGCSFNYVLTKHFCLFMDVDLMHAKPMFDGTTQGEDMHGAQTQKIYYGDPQMPHTVVSVLLGVGFKLPGLHFYN